MVQTLFILKLEPGLDPEPEKLSEYGAWWNQGKTTHTILGVE